MSVVSNFVSRMEHQAWEFIEKCAIKNPNVSRAFSVAVAIEEIAKAALLAPAMCIETMILTGKSVKDYLSTSDQQQKDVHLQQCKKRAYAILKGVFVVIPVSLILLTLAAIVQFVRMIINPLGTSKHQIAYLDCGAYVHSAPDHEMFAEAARDRFCGQLQECGTDAEKAALHFMDTEDAKAKLIAEFNAKQAVLDRESRAYVDLRDKPFVDNANAKTRISAQWKQFKEAVAKADPADVDGMKFLAFYVVSQQVARASQQVATA